jgi:DNA-binding transcriptional regulator PaaX
MAKRKSSTDLNHVLSAVSAEGLSGMTASATSLLGALETLDAFPAGLSGDEKRAIVANLRRLGLVEITKSGKTIRIQPAVKGIHRLQRAKLDELFIQPQQNWDGIWRMVSYDIPARHSKQRRLMTAQLHRLGFTLVKDSMWFHPYPCFDVISELIAYCGLTQFVMIAEIARLDESTLSRLFRRYTDLR